MLIEAFNRVGVLQDILSKVTFKHVNITQISSRIKHETGVMKAKITVEVSHNKELIELERLILELRDVYQVVRYIA